MPKILQKTLLTSIINFIICIFIYYTTFTVINILSGYIFDTGEDIMVFVLLIISELSDTRIPSYIFIAPFSKSDRINLQKKLFLYNTFARWFITSAFILLPKIILTSGNKVILSSGKYIFEMAIIYFLIFIAGHLRYFYLINKINFTFTGLSLYIFTILVFPFSLYIITEDISSTGYYILMAVTGICTILISLYCYKKHFKSMLEFYSDYELSAQIKNI